jgi:hypothetical protein
MVCCTSADGSAARENERLEFFSHELRNLLQTALVASLREMPGPGHATRPDIGLRRA